MKIIEQEFHLHKGMPDFFERLDQVEQIPYFALSDKKPQSIDPDYRKFDRAFKTEARPVLVSLQRSPFRDFTAEGFMGDTLFTCIGHGRLQKCVPGQHVDAWTNG